MRSCSTLKGCYTGANITIWLPLRFGSDGFWSVLQNYLAAWTPDWTEGSVHAWAWTLDWTLVRFTKVQVRTLVQDRTAASLLDTVQSPALILLLDAQKILSYLMNIPLEEHCCIQLVHYLLFMASSWMQQCSSNGMFIKQDKIFWASRSCIRAGDCTVSSYSMVFCIC